MSNQYDRYYKQWVKKYQVVQEELDQLTEEQQVLVMAHQEKVEKYEKQMTIYQYLFGKPALQPDLELQAITTKIEDLKVEQSHVAKVIATSASQSAPIKDWSKYPIHWKRLAKWGPTTPIEQIYTYVLFIGGVGHGISCFFRAHHLRRIPLSTPGTEQGIHHRMCANVTPHQLEFPIYWAYRLRLRGIVAFSAPWIYMWYTALKRMSN